MKKMLIGLVAVGGLSLVGGLATNAAADTRVDQRQQIQEQRIRDGLAAGRLTRAEFRALMREQRDISRMEARAEADGRVTWQERREIERAQDVANHNIRRMVRDVDYRGDAGHGQYR